MFPSNRLMEIALGSFLPLVKGAVFFTVTLSLVSFAIGLVLAVLTALAKLSPFAPLRWLASAYISAIRGTPLLVQLYILFYGLAHVGIRFDPYTAAIIGFSLNTGAYAAETVRAAILSIPKGQWEAAASLGMTCGQTLRRIIFPQAARVAVPPLSNSFISLIKDTSLAAVILVPEMFRKAQEIVATTYEPLLLYGEAALIYWLICTGLSFVQGKLEKRLARYVAK